MFSYEFDGYAFSSSRIISSIIRKSLNSEVSTADDSLSTWSEPSLAADSEIKENSGYV